MHYQLSKKESLSLREIATTLQQQFKTVDNPSFQEVAHEYAYDIPKTMMIALSQFDRHDEPYLQVTGLTIDDALLQDTPASWRDRRSPEAYTSEFMHYLLASHVGLPFSWKTQQDGRTINDILPVKEFEHEQLAISSKSNLMWHVEDAFHDARGEFLSLMCLRNRDAVPTLLSAPDLTKLSPKAVRELMTPQYLVRADDAHDLNSNLNEVGGDPELRAAFEEARNLRKVALLFGSASRPYMRLDMDTFGREEFVSDDARSAYHELCALVEEHAIELLSNQGDVIIVNNFLAVHGRPPFEPRYDGTDRWLQRLLVNSDFRKTAPYRQTINSTVLYA